MNADNAGVLLGEAIARITGQTLDIGGLFGYGDQLKRLGRKSDVIELYKAWIAYNASSPFLHAAYFNYGVALGELPDPNGAVNAFRECLRIKPDFYQPQINLAGLLERLGQVNIAVETWMALINKLAPIASDAIGFKTTALKQLGRILEINKADASAEDALRQSLEINPHQSDVIQHWIALRLRQCKWPVISDLGQMSAKSLIADISPLSIACYTDDPLLQTANAYRYNKTAIGVPAKPRDIRCTVTPSTRKPGPMRIGYVSSDLREHAVGFSLTEVMEFHDRAAFEIFAYYCGVPANDSTNQRIKGHVDHWLDISGMSDIDAAQRIKDDAIDILIDLNGYTKDARTKVFSMRPAPIAVNWFGFPGTMGSPYHHYLIADGTTIPPDLEMYYSEKVVRLDCYQPNDRKRVVANPGPSRQDAGLPDDAFVFCALNGMQKITPRMFERWMRILRDVPNGVLWMLSGTAETNQRLRDAAAAVGVDGARLIFAASQANPDHVARYGLADLFLDTMPYGAHTTAADALWMGVPIITLPGRSFASRVCASLMRAAGIGDLVCTDGEDYVARAIGFGRDPASLAPFKRRLVESRDTCLLFDSPRLVRQLENLYRQMWQDFVQGRLPVPDLTNLDIYHEIGITLDLANIEALSEDDYHAVYRDRLADLDAVYPVRHDQRLWKV